jgi:hypothetical protein
VEKKLRASLIFHGAIVVILGLLAGFPYALVLQGQMAGEPRAWSMAHLEGVLNGLLCLGAAGAFGKLALSARQLRAMTWSFILMAYGNVVASVIGAVTGQRGLELAGPMSNTIVFVLFMIAVVLVLVALGLLAYGSRPGTGGFGDVQVEVKTVSASSATAAARPRASSIPRGVDVEVSVSRSGEPAPAVGGGPDDDDDFPDGDTPMNRAERRRAKKGR